jgi:hypothetical protein
MLLSEAMRDRRFLKIALDFVLSVNQSMMNSGSSVADQRNRGRTLAPSLTQELLMCCCVSASIQSRIRGNDRSFDVDRLPAVEFEDEV